SEALQVKVNLSSSLGRVTHFMDLMNTEQYLEVRKEAMENSGVDYTNQLARTAWPDLSERSQNRYNDWQKKFIGATANRNKVKISLSGGIAQTHFLIGGSMMGQSTVFPGDSKYKKTAVLSNVNHHSKDHKFKMNLSINYTRDNNN